MKYVLFTTFFYITTPVYYLFINSIIIIMILISLIIYKHLNIYDYIIIIINVILEVLFNYFFLINKNSLLIFTFKFLQFIFSIHLNESIYSNKKSANLLVPYILWNFILTLYTTAILFLDIGI